MGTYSSVSDRLLGELKQVTPFGIRGAEALVAILRTADVLRRRLAATMEPHGITVQQYNVLRILRGAHPHPLPTLEIRERLIEHAPGITRLVDVLAERGLVRRARCEEDRRQVHCWITEEGLELLAGLDGPVDALDEGVVSALTEAQVDELLEALDAVRHGAGPGAP